MPGPAPAQVQTGWTVSQEVSQALGVTQICTCPARQDWKGLENRILFFVFFVYGNFFNYKGDYKKTQYNIVIRAQRAAELCGSCVTLGHIT